MYAGRKQFPKSMNPIFNRYCFTIYNVKGVFLHCEQHVLYNVRESFRNLVITRPFFFTCWGRWWFCAKSCLQCRSTRPFLSTAFLLEASTGNVTMRENCWRRGWRWLFRFTNTLTTTPECSSNISQSLPNVRLIRWKPERLGRQKKKSWCFNVGLSVKCHVFMNYFMSTFSGVLSARTNTKIRFVKMNWISVSTTV